MKLKDFKLRVWDKVTKMMWDKDSFIPSSMNALFEWIELSGTPNDFDVLLFTGKLDSDGKEIYDGDILHSTYWNRNNLKGSSYHVVKWNNLKGCWVVEGWNGFSKVEPNLDIAVDFKIVGNIKQDEYLLEIKKR